MHDPFKTAFGVQNSGPWDPWQARLEKKNPWCTSRGCSRIHDPGTHGYRWWKTVDFSHSAGAAHSAPPKERMCKVQSRTWFQKQRKPVSPFRSCTLCVRGSAQRRDAARPHAVSLRLPLGAHGAREGPVPGLRCPQCWTCRALHPGPLSLPKVAETTPTVARTRALLSRAGGGG